MKDFAVELKGLPPLAADQQSVELDIKKEVEKVLKKEIVGVSIAWNFMEKEEAVMGAVQENQLIQGLAYDAVHDGPGEAEVHESQDSTNPLRSFFTSVEKPWICPEDADVTKRRVLEDKVHEWQQQNKTIPVSEDAKKKLVRDLEKKLTNVGGEDHKKDVLELLKEIKSSGTAFVVFKTEDDKEDALQLMETNGGLPFKEHTLTVQCAAIEPATLNWQNFGESGFSVMVGRFLKAFFTYYVPALLIWFVVFYVPYAWSLYDFNYENGAELPGYYSLIFTMVVVGGNATMQIPLFR
jgi:hypothetical protein